MPSQVGICVQILFWADCTDGDTDGVCVNGDCVGFVDGDDRTKST